MSKPPHFICGGFFVPTTKPLWPAYCPTFVLFMGIIANIGRYFGGKSGTSVPETPISAPDTQETRSGVSAATLDQWFADYISGGPKVAGVHVTPENSLTISAVYACNRILSNTIASLSLGLYRRLPNGDIEPVENLPEYQAVCVEPHDLYTSYTWRSTAQLHMGMTGNAYNRLYFDRNGRVNKIRLINGTVCPFLYQGKLFYKISDAETDGMFQSYTLPASEVLHVKNISDDGLIGKSPITVARQTIGMALAANKYASSMYAQGGTMRGFVEHPQKLKEGQIAEIRKAFLQVMSDYENTGGIGVLSDGMKFSRVSLSPKDAQFIETHQLTIQDISRYYGVPLHMIGDLSRATFSNIEHQGIEYTTHTVRPIVKTWESELNRRVLRKSDQGTLFFRFNLDSLLRGDTASRAEFYTKLFNIGAMSPDEIRAHENLNKIQGGYGAQHFRPLNMVSLDQEAETNLNDQEEAPEPITDINEQAYESGQ
jgi:HK97 family phage portal protein